jgi:hypothetical protein
MSIPLRAIRPSVVVLACALTALIAGTQRIEPVEAATTPPEDPAAAARVREIYAQLPLAFEANEGQTDARVKFLSRGDGYTLFLTPTQAVLALRTASRATAGATRAVVRMTVVGANAAPRVAGVDMLPGKSHYFSDADTERWRTDVPTFAKVRYSAVYPGVDLLYYGSGRRLEYDFVVKPGADPRAIALRFEGARDLTIDAGGELVLGLGATEIRQPRPVVYQEVDGVRRHVDGRYVMIASDQVGFEVGSYDRRRELVIDPVLIYSTYLGGSGVDTGQGLAVAIDREGEAYVTGLTNSPNFPTTPGAFQPVNEASEVDAFVTKLNRTGTALVYSTYLGGIGFDFGSGIAVDDEGHAYVTGGTQSPDFPVTPDAFQPINAGGSDAFVTKLNRGGSALVYSTYLGGTLTENVDQGSGAIVVDRFGQAYVTGHTDSPNFPTTPDAFQPVNRGLTDAFVTKVNRRGSALVFSTYLGGAGRDRGAAIDLPGDDDHDTGREVFVTGVTDSPDFPTTRRAFQPLLAGATDAFVTSLNRRGSDLVYSTYLGGRAADDGRDVAVNAAGQAFVTGTTSSLDFPVTVGAFQMANAGGTDAFVTRLSRGGSGLQYSTYLGGTGPENGNPFAGAIAIDAANQAYVTGGTASPNFPTTPDAFQPVNAGGSDVFVTALASRGTALRYSTYLGGATTDYGAAIAVERSARRQRSRDIEVYLTGGTASPNYPTTPGAFQPANAGNFDAFVTKMAIPSREDRDNDDDDDDDDRGGHDGGPGEDRD